MRGEKTDTTGMIVALAGLPGTGKGTLAKGLAALCGGLVFDLDLIRRALFPVGSSKPSNKDGDFCLEVLMAAVTYHVKQTRDRHWCVFVDGCSFLRDSQIDEMAETAKKLHAMWCIVECTCSEAIAKKRLRERILKPLPPAHDWCGVYEWVKKNAQDSLCRAGNLQGHRCVIHTDRHGIKSCLAAAHKYVQELRRQSSTSHPLRGSIAV